MSDFEKLDGILDLTKILDQADISKLNNSSFDHPFDLSKNHSNLAELQDVSKSEDDLPPPRRRNKYKRKDGNSSDEMSSVIASDSSFEHRMEPLDEDLRHD